MPIRVVPRFEGDCFIYLDSAQGSTPHLQFDVPVRVSSGGSTAVIGTVKLSGFEDADGHFGGIARCGLIADPARYVPVLAKSLESYLRNDLCKVCGCA